MRIIKLIITIILFILILTGCTESTENQNTDICGFVYDAGGNPVANAGILLEYKTDLEPERPYINISFNIANECNVKLWITTETLSDTVRVLMDCMLSAGCHQVEWNMENEFDLIVKNGYYIAHVQTDENYSTMKLLFNFGIWNEYSHQQFDTFTTSNGYFSIPQDGLPFNSSENQIDFYDEYGNFGGNISVNRYIKIWVSHPDFEHPVFLDSVYVNENEPTELELYFNIQ